MSEALWCHCAISSRHARKRFAVALLPLRSGAVVILGGTLS